MVSWHELLESVPRMHQALAGLLVAVESCLHFIYFCVFSSLMLHQLSNLFRVLVTSGTVYFSEDRDERLGDPVTGRSNFDARSSRTSLLRLQAVQAGMATYRCSLSLYP